MKSLLVALVLTSALISGGVALAQSGNTAPSTGNIAIRDGINPGEVVVSWDAVPEATHYRIGYVNMETDYLLAKSSVTGDWINAFIYVDENARNIQVSNGRAEYTIRRLEQGVHHEFTVLTSNYFVDSGGGGSVSSTFAWPPKGSRWEEHTVADRGGAPAPTPGFDFVSMYPNCDAVRAHYPGGVRVGSPIYRPALDRDGDGIACEAASTPVAVDYTSLYPNCDAVRAHHPGGVKQGSPIYRPALDPDQDGLACEPAATLAIVGYDGCLISSPPAELMADPFYTKYCDANGIPVLSSSEVPDLALKQAWNILMNMLITRPDLREAISANGIRFGVIGVDEVTTDMPEYADLYEAFPGIDWDVRARGLGATLQRPLTSSAEENLLCYTGDVYRGESIAVHEFAHTIHTVGLRHVEPEFDERLDGLYAEAIAAGLWKDTYAATNALEYWAEGVQSYFDTNSEGQPGVHNFVNTHDELREYDPDLYDLIAEVFRDFRWTPTCPQ